MDTLQIVDAFSVIATIVAVYLFCRCLFENNLKTTAIIVFVIFWFCFAAYFDYERAKEFLTML